MRFCPFYYLFSCIISDPQEKWSKYVFTSFLTHRSTKVSHNVYCLCSDILLIQNQYTISYALHETYLRLAGMTLMLHGFPLSFIKRMQSVMIQYPSMHFALSSITEIQIIFYAYRLLNKWLFNDVMFIWLHTVSLCLSSTLSLLFWCYLFFIADMMFLHSV